jgi:cytochrome b
MNVTSASPAETRKILVWDAPVRVFHWLLVICFAGAYITAESERWRLLHVTLGYTMAALVVFRIIWGITGTRYARFAQFVRGPSEVTRYLKSMFKSEPAHYTGHNPAGAVAILALLILALVLTLSGWANLNDWGGDWTREAHELVANLMLAVIGVHVAGVVLGSWRHRENLVGAMVTGRKVGAPGEGIARAWGILAAFMLAVALAFWWVQWQSAPSGGSIGSAAVVEKMKNQEKDDD